MNKQPLSKLIVSAQSGIVCGQRDDMGIVQLRLNNLLTNGEVDFAGHVRIPSNVVPDKMLLEPGDVLFNNTNSVELVGKTSYFDGYEEKVTFSNHVTRLRVKPDVLDARYTSRGLDSNFSEGLKNPSKVMQKVFQLLVTLSQAETFYELSPLQEERIMIQIAFTTQAINELAYERYHYPDPKVQRRIVTSSPLSYFSLALIPG
ncbi:MAG: hypothetical protein BECKG1743D_GA0114223_106731 [Candidatus Kentron sp. G]|nr:MAG: hypothetical protein BECKG1743F_GA0114225_106341 [Candidatus Kentron sp. G]VFN03617.1 MAG: hypothetical protein BECKG1743E_GA0114224_106352 [Candidatus Kentron sp. G]VFN05105.1 MAG: hypothetical protein BECKG1743D_GA0114223_106731 [Candidatus Kentron sp. G]